MKPAAQLGDNASPSVSFFSTSLSLLLHSQTCSASLLLLLFEALCQLFDCHQHLAQGQDLPLHMHATAHACEHNPPYHLPFLSRKHAHTTQLPLHACFKDITETSTKREGALANGFIYVPELQLTSIFITHSKRRAPVTQEMD